MFVYFNANYTIKAISESPVKVSNAKCISTEDVNAVHPKNLVGKKLILGPQKPISSLKVAVICNWGDQCGIATYTNDLMNSLMGKVGEVHIFAEVIDGVEDQEFVTRCWRRGESMISAIEAILAWKPDIVHVQHEFGIFPKATHFLKMLEMLECVPYVVTLHSVYEHLDKTICTAFVKNIIVHSQQGKQMLQNLGHSSSVYVVTHGCGSQENIEELWNIFQNDYAIVQFGFGFRYKGVDTAIEAIRKLKEIDPKFKDIFYCYLGSENPHTSHVHEEYYTFLRQKIAEAGLIDNVVILRGFLSAQLISNFLRTAKLAIFPYRTDPNNRVYGASGAIRHAMANGIPVIASNSHLFDDMDNVVPRISDADSLAKEIDRMFSDHEYRRGLVEKNLNFVKANSWDHAADNHLAVYADIIATYHERCVCIENFTEV